MTYYRHHNIRRRGVCLSLEFSGPGEEKDVYLKGFENVIERHMRKSLYFKLFLGIFCLKLMVYSRDRKCGGRERRMTCTKGPQLDLNQGHCGYMVCVLSPTMTS